MYLVEYINEERDVVFRQSFKNVKKFLETVYNFPSTFEELVTVQGVDATYADASVNGTLISRFYEGDLIVTLSLEGLLQEYEVLENFHPSKTWDKLWLKPVPEKIQAYLTAVGSSRLLLPFISLFTVKGRQYSLEEGDTKLPYKLFVLKEEPGKIFEEKEDGSFTFFSNIVDFEPQEVVSASSSLITICSYKESLCPSR